MLQNGLNVRLKAIFIIHTPAAGSILHLPLENEVISSNINISDFRITKIIEADAKKKGNSSH